VQNVRKSWTHCMIVKMQKTSKEKRENKTRSMNFNAITSSFRENDDRRHSSCSCVARYVSCFAKSRQQLHCSFNNFFMILKEIFIINVMFVNIKIFVINFTYVSKRIFVVNEIFVIKITFVINVIFYEFIYFRNIIFLMWCLIILIYVF
jgi:hypothetical protein